MSSVMLIVKLKVFRGLITSSLRVVSVIGHEVSKEAGVLRAQGKANPVSISANEIEELLAPTDCHIAPQSQGLTGHRIQRVQANACAN